MFKTIEPKSQCYYRSRIDLLMGLMRFYQDVPLSSEEQRESTFIVGEDGDRGIHGGAILHRMNISSLHSQLKNIVLSIAPHKKEVWMGILSFCIENEKLPSRGDRVNYCQKLYKNLFQKLVEFGNTEGTPFLCVTLNPFEYLRTKNTGFWPYLLEINPQESLDGLFHGILPLSKI